MPRPLLVNRRASPLGIALLLTFALSSISEAQLPSKLGRAITNAAESEASRQVDKLVREGVRCVFDDAKCIRDVKAAGKEPVLTDANGEVVVDAKGNPVGDPPPAGQSGKMPAPGEGSWANYDFRPGDEILLYEDFTRDRVGDFPRRMELVEGAFEVVEWEGGRYLRATSGGLIALPLPSELPERFTVEFEVNLRHGNAYVRLMPGPAYFGRSREYGGTVVSVEAARAGVRPATNQGPTAMTPVADKRTTAGIVPVRVMGDGDYLKVYLGERRVANVPNAVFPRSDKLYVAVSSANESLPILIGAIRVAKGGPDLYDRLDRDGRVATQGILFATNSASIRPESTPTLAEIARMLRDHPELRLGIEGHTDTDGETAYNQTLSQQRAAAVKAYLVERHRIAEARLQAAGFGESRPAADNASPEGKQQNRRVELVRL
jgi:outer membrane protein OmpA-like peptidoglycan-associated protein